MKQHPTPVPPSPPYLDRPGHIFLRYPTVTMESVAVYLTGQTFSSGCSRQAPGSWLLPGSRKHVIIFEVVKYRGARRLEEQAVWPLLYKVGTQSGVCWVVISQAQAVLAGWSESSGTHTTLGSCDICVFTFLLRKWVPCSFPSENVFLSLLSRRQ